jgi:hypothetical protein
MIHVIIYIKSKNLKDETGIMCILSKILHNHEVQHTYMLLQHVILIL